MPESAVLYILMTAIGLYFFGAVLSLLFSHNNRANRRIAYTAAALASAAGTIAALIKLMNPGSQPTQLQIHSNLDFLSYNFSVDHLSAFFILLISFLTMVVSIYSYGYAQHYETERKTGFLGGMFNLFAASMLLVVMSDHLFTFLIAWELMSLVSYFLVVYEHEKPEVRKAGTVYIVMTHIGTAFIMAAFILLYQYAGTADLSQINISSTPTTVKHIVFVLLLLGFGTKAGMVPLHIWLPSAHPAAPSHVSSLMSGVMIKTAIYGIFRFILDIMASEYRWWGTVILIAGIVSTVIGVAYALMENNIKRLLAYSSIENIGIILVGTGLAVMSASSGAKLAAAFAVTAALLHTLNHTLFKGLLFLGAGAIHYSTGTKDMEKLGGLIKKMPYTAVFILAGCLSISAIPPLNGFVSEWLTYQSLFVGMESSGNLNRLVILACAALLALAGALAAYTFVKMFGISFLALPRTSHAEKALEAGRPMLAGMGILAALCIAAGVLPMLVIKLIDSINTELFQQAAVGRMSGFAGFVTLPLNIGDSAISMSTTTLMIILFASLLAIVAILAAAKTKMRKYGTWDCGYRGLDSRMQYSATGFSKPMRIVFRGLYRPQRELKVEEGSGPYFIKSATYEVSHQPLFERFIYEPFVKGVFRFARRARYIIQTGSIHAYLLYIFAAILLMFIYYAVT